MPIHTNTHPYTNAAREGRTKPGLIEIIAPSDPRSQGPRYVANRADRRANGQRTSAFVAPLRNPASRYQRRHGLAVAA